MTPIILTFVGIGFYHFFTHYKEIKRYASIFLEAVGIVFIFYLIFLLIKLFIYNEPTNFKELFVNCIVYSRNVILASVGAYLLLKQNLPVAPLLLNHDETKKNRWISILSGGFWAFFLMTIAAIFLLAISSHSIFTIRTNSILDFFAVLLRAFLVSFAEEIFHRLFLQSLFLNWFRKIKPQAILSIVFTSIIWAIQHPGILETNGLVFIEVFLFGIILGILMLKRGLEACIIAHALFNFLAETYLGHF